ncbi:hypothetical protein MHN01_13565, partial [Photobacterium sp. OFAV2-7]|nr:hypothetical protein [Photobacterium sp. OFAV2-7]
MGRTRREGGKVSDALKDGLLWFIGLPMAVMNWVGAWVEKAADKSQSVNQRERVSFSKLLLTVLVGVASVLCLTVPFAWQAQVIFVLLLWLMAMMI